MTPVYDPENTNQANPGFRFQENQQPLLLAGYHHEWAPGIHTLVLAGRLKDELQVTNSRQGTYLLAKDVNGKVTDGLPITLEQRYQSNTEIYTAELQQIWQQANHSVTVGARYQSGAFATQNQHAHPVVPLYPFLAGLFPTNAQNVTPDFRRANVYGYYRWQIADPLLLVAGLNYDWLRMPENFRYAPINGGEETKDQVSPKGGFIWTPFRTTTLRAGYAQALNGVAFDQSFQLEPTQVAGFNQAFRSILPEAVAGANGGARFETWGFSLEQRIGRGTYLALSGEWLDSDVNRTRGVYDLLPSFTVNASGTRERLNYTERTLTFTANQLIGAGWSLGLRYRLSQAELHDLFEQIPSDARFPFGFEPERQESGLHQLQLFALYQDPRGFFGRAEGWWYRQRNDGYEGARPGDEFWQCHLWAGYRFPRRRAEVLVGLLNVTDQDYRLNPLNLTPELPRGRTVAVRLEFAF